MGKSGAEKYVLAPCLKTRLALVPALSLSSFAAPGKPVFFPGTLIFFFFSIWEVGVWDMLLLIWVSGLIPSLLQLLPSTWTGVAQTIQKNPGPERPSTGVSARLSGSSLSPQLQSSVFLPQTHARLHRQCPSLHTLTSKP